MFLNFCLQRSQIIAMAFLEGKQLYAKSGKGVGNNQAKKKKKIRYKKKEKEIQLDLVHVTINQYTFPCLSDLVNHPYTPLSSLLFVL